MIRTILRLTIFNMLFSASMLASALDLGTESTADKADRFDFEEFHKEKGITLWESEKEKSARHKKPAAPHESTAATPAPVTPAEQNLDPSPDTSKAHSDNQHFEKGQALKVREAYKLGNDPALRQVPSLYEATESLHKQLNNHCPRGWAKEKEWHKSEQNYFFIHYSAVCL